MTTFTPSTVTEDLNLADDVARAVQVLRDLADRYALRGSCAPWASIWETV